MALHTLAIWLPLILLCPLLLLLRKKGREKKQLPPSPPKLPILGNLHQLGALPHQSLWQLSKKYGPVMSLQLGRLPAVIISSAEAAREALKTHDLACCSRPPLVGVGKLTHNNADMCFTPYGEYWRHLRKISVIELFSLKRVRSFQSIREEEIAALMKSISQSASTSTPVDLNHKLFSLTASIIFRIAFGRSFQGSSLHHDIHEVVHECEAVMGSFSAQEYFPYVGRIIDRLTGHQAWLDRVFHKMDSFFQQIIDDHIESGSAEKDQEDIVDLMLRIQRDQTEEWTTRLTKESIKGVLLNIFLGGIDTGAITVIWAMAELVKKPDLMRKAQSEVRNHIGNKGRVTEGDIIEQLPYLNMIIKETLRLHPPAPLLLAREVISHFKINGYNIYPKTFLQINAWGIGRDPNYWKDPEDFIPERFEDSSIDFRGQNFEFLPFGAGRRICPGINMATTFVELALANLLYWFDWKLPNGLKEEEFDMEESVGHSLTVSKKTGLTLVPVNYLESLPVDNTS